MPVSSRRVPPSGPANARIFVCGEGPGREEDERGRPFIGASGKILRAMMLDYAGIDLRYCRVSNLSKYRLTDERGKDRPPTMEEFLGLHGRLVDEVIECGPELVITMGAWSTRALIGMNGFPAYPMSVLNGNLYRFSPQIAVLPVVHPAAGLRSPQLLASTAYGLKQVGRWLRGKRVREPRDKHPNPQYVMCDPRQPWSFFGLPAEIGFDTEGYADDPWSLQVSVRPGEGFLIRADDETNLRHLRYALEQDRPTILLHHALHDLPVSAAMGIDIIKLGLPFRDTLIELFLRQTDPQGLKESAPRLCGMEMRTYEEVVGPVAESFARAHLLHAFEFPPIEWLFGEGRKHSMLKRLDGMLWPRPTKGERRSIRQKWEDEENFGVVRRAVESACGPLPSPRMDDIPAEEFVPYACRDADATLRQSRITGPSMKRLGLEEAHRIDHDAIPLIARMQEVGMTIDMQKLDELRDYIADEKRQVLEGIRLLTGIADFNPASGDQIAAYLLAKGVKLGKLTKGGKRPTVDENALTLVRFEDEAIEPILHYKELDKLEGTYVMPLYGFAVGTGRFRLIFPHLYLTNAITGRLAASEPNLLAFPTRSALGRRVRGLFVARPGFVMWSADLSQIELRVGAGFSQDEGMIQAFIDGIDLHTLTASQLFGVAMAEVDENTQRYPCKTGNFAIFYGAREHRLNAEFLKAGIRGFVIDGEWMDTSPPACAKFVEKWFELRPRVETWIGEVIDEGRKTGVVRTAAGRMRHVPALRLEGEGYPLGWLREKTERETTNFPIQGTAGEIIKKAAPAVLKACNDLGAHPFLLVHDDFTGEVLEENAEELQGLIGEAMLAESPWRGVPLKNSWKTASDWSRLK